MGTVKATAVAGNPVVVLWDSGGAAEAVYEEIQEGDDVDEEEEQVDGECDTSKLVRMLISARTPPIACTRGSPSHSPTRHLLV